MTEPPIAERPSSGNALAAIALSAVALWVGLFCALTATVGVVYGNAIGLLGVAVAVLGTIAVIALICRWLTGRARVPAAMTVTGMAIVSLLIAVLNARASALVAGGPGFQVASMFMALATAFVLGAFLGPAWLRAIGALAALATLCFWCWALASNATSASLQPVSLDDQYQTFVDAHGSSLVSTVAGSEIISLDSVGSSAQLSWIRTADEGVLQIAVDMSRPSEELARLYPCWMIADPSMLVESSDVVADYADWCVPYDDGWARTDGMGFVRVDHGGMIAVRSVDSFQIENVGDGRGHPATAAEVAAALDALRPISDDELHELFVQTLD